MTISLEQFRVLAPSATLATQAALFERDSTLAPQIERILTTHGITEPPAVAMFLACVSLASNGFTKFDRPIFGLAPLDWLTARAREWQELGLSVEAIDWNWEYVVQRAATEWDAAETSWPHANATLTATCEALGVEERIIDE